VELVVLVAILATSLILGAAGAEHVARQSKLRSRMRTHGVLGPRAVGVVSTVLPVLELLGGLGAVWFVVTSGRFGIIASLVVQTALYWLFAGYLVLVVRAGNAGLPCGCGVAEAPAGGSAIVRAIALGVVSCSSAASLITFGLDSVSIRANAQGLLAITASLSISVLLTILPSARRIEPTTRPRIEPQTGLPAKSSDMPDSVMMGSV
jgi:hypothetical protein